MTSKGVSASSILAALLLLGFFVFQITPLAFAVGDSPAPSPGEMIQNSLPTNQSPIPPSVAAPADSNGRGVNFIPNVHLNYIIPGVNNDQKELDVSSIQNLQEKFIKPFFNTLFGIGGIIAVFGIALGGLQRMAAGASIGSVQAGNDKIFNAIVGVIILLSSFLLLRTINPKILGGVNGKGDCKDTGQLNNPEAAAKNSLCPLPKFTESKVQVNPSQPSADNSVNQANADQRNQTNTQVNDAVAANKASVDKLVNEAKTIEQKNATIETLRTRIAEQESLQKSFEIKAAELTTLKRQLDPLLNDSNVATSITDAQATVINNALKDVKDGGHIEKQGSTWYHISSLTQPVILDGNNNAGVNGGSVNYFNSRVYQPIKTQWANMNKLVDGTKRQIAYMRTAQSKLNQEKLDLQTQKNKK